MLLGFSFFHHLIVLAALLLKIDKIHDEFFKFFVEMLLDIVHFANKLSKPDYCVLRICRILFLLNFIDVLVL